MEHEIEIGTMAHQMRLGESELVKTQRQLAAEKARADAAEAKLLYWQTCMLCGEKMDEPGHCSNADSEIVTSYREANAEQAAKLAETQAVVREVQGIVCYEFCRGPLHSRACAKLRVLLPKEP